MLTLNKPEVEEYLSRARSALGVGAYDIALNCTAAAIAADGKNPTAYFLNGQAHLAAHSYAAAEASYKKAISLGFQAAACSFGLGASQAMGGYYSAALRNFTLALRQPGCSEEMRLTICHQLALLSLQMGDAAAALRYFDKEDEVPVVNPHLTESLVHRVSIHISRNENDQALLCAEQLIRLHPDEFDYHHVYANVLIRYAAAEKLDAARNALEQAHALCTEPVQEQLYLSDCALVESARAELDPAAADACRAHAVQLLQRAAAVKDGDAAQAAACGIFCAELFMTMEQPVPALKEAQSIAAQQTLDGEIRAQAAFLASELLVHLDREAEAAVYIPLLKASGNSQYRCHGYYLAYRLAADESSRQKAYGLATAQFRKAAAEHDTTAAVYRIKLEADEKHYDRARQLIRTVPAALRDELEEYLAKCEKED